MKREDIYYQAVKSRDPRFDGKFFTGVKTTGIYCRPICPARPKRENVEFYPSAIEAEKAGYRPCMRCRPESAPQSPVWIGKSAVVQRAIKVLNRPDTLEFDEDRFADLFGVTARHLRRLFVDEIGKTPKQLSFENRLNLARKLIVETSLSQSEVAHASGFKSIRRFNDAFKTRFKKSPSQIRQRKTPSADGLVVTLSYRPPYGFDGLLRSYQAHRVGDLERVTADTYHRVVEHNGKVGQVSVSNDPDHSRLRVAIDFPDTSIVYSLLSQVRSMFDLDSDPVLIANSLELEFHTKKLLKKHPGIRLPSGWNPFEVAISVVLGQLVTVNFGRQLVADLVQLLGKEIGLEIDGKQIKRFPSAEAIANSDLKGLKTTTSRKRTLQKLASAIASGKISLQPTQDVERFIRELRAIPGIGPWTAEIIALKVLRHTDAFPETDLILAQALQRHPLKHVQKMSPWRAYAAALYWREYAYSIKKPKKRSKK